MCHSHPQDFVKKRTVADMTDLMCQESTAHGVGHTWNNRRNLLGVFWFLVTVSLFALLLYVAATLSSDFLAREVQSQVFTSKYFYVSQCLVNDTHKKMINK
uniref:Uncharacterized protein n=1 Tax=Scylla olivacea TaxID=85551 RepID=A0A0P4WL08_SCYOL